MVGRYATSEADITITHHLPPPDDDSTQDVSMSFVIPPQADASNLLDQNCDDFFSGPGLVTLSTPVLPRHLTNTRHPVRKLAGPIQTPAAVPSTILGQTLPTHSTTELEPPDDRVELQETHILPHPSSPSLSPPTVPFMSMDAPTTTSVVGMASIVDPGSPRPSDALSESGPVRNGLKSNTALPMTSIITTKATGTQPGIQSASASVPSRHSTNTQNTQISRQPPIPAPQKKNKGPAQSRGTASAKSKQAASKPRSGNVLFCETTSTQSRVSGGAAKRLKPTLSNRGVGSVKGQFQSNPASSNSRSNVECHAYPTGSEHSDPDLLSDPAERYGAVTQSLVTTVLPPSGSIQSRFNLVSDGADSNGSSSSPDPPRTTEDHVGAKITQGIREEEHKDDDRLTVFQLSPSKTVREGSYNSEGSDCSESGIKPSPEPTPRTSIAVSPMRPSRKREASAGHESDTEPGGAWPGEWEKGCLIIESDREGEVRGGGAGKEDQQLGRVEHGEKPWALLQPSRRENRVASGSLTLTRRLKAKAIRESPRVRKLRDKLAGRVVAGGGAGRRRTGIGGAPEVSRGRHTTLDPENVGVLTTTSVAMHEGKGSDPGETTGPSMPYGGDNQQQGGAINKITGSIMGGPSFRSTLKRSTVPVEFRFKLAGRLGTSRDSAAKENPGSSASRNNREDGKSRKRPKLGELGDAKSGAVGLEEPSSSRLREANDHHDQTGGHASAWKGSTCSRSNNSSATSMGRSKRRMPLIVPEAFRFSTEQRAKEREKFDEGVRVKQKEKERQLEEDRAAKVVEEGREMKEMRRRAVPKANTIPEWYATMPKRKAA